LRWHLLYLVRGSGWSWNAAARPGPRGCGGASGKSLAIQPSPESHVPGSFKTPICDLVTGRRFKDEEEVSAACISELTMPRHESGV
jgi:hypothetical protein